MMHTSSLYVPNKIVEKLQTYNLSGEESRMVWTIIRQTYGYNKKEDKISYSQFSEKTGIKRPNASTIAKQLKSKNVINIKKEKINIYSLNENVEEWLVLSNQITPLLSNQITALPLLSNQITPKNTNKNAVLQVLSNRITAVPGVIQSDTQVLSNRIHTKDNLTKDNKSFKEIYKEKGIAEYPVAIHTSVPDNLVVLQPSRITTDTPVPDNQPPNDVDEKGWKKRNKQKLLEDRKFKKKEKTMTPEQFLKKDGVIITNAIRKQNATAKPKENFSHEFLDAWENYPKRHTADNKASGWRQWKARIAAGHKHEEIKAGVLRYKIFCERTGKLGSEFVMMAKTFFGRDEHFALEWNINAIKKNEVVNAGQSTKQQHQKLSATARLAIGDDYTTRRLNAATGEIRKIRERAVA